MNNALILWDPSAHTPPTIHSGSDTEQTPHSLEKTTEEGLGHHCSHPLTQLPFH